MLQNWMSSLSYRQSRLSFWIGREPGAILRSLEDWASEEKRLIADIFYL
jgi:hypothetical protein